MGNEIWPWYWQERVYRYDVIFFDSDWANFINADIGTCLYELQSESNIGNNGEYSLFQGNNDFEIWIKI